MEFTQRLDSSGAQPTQQVSVSSERTQQVGAGTPTVMGAPTRALQMECLLGREMGNAYGDASTCWWGLRAQRRVWDGDCP